MGDRGLVALAWLFLLAGPALTQEDIPVPADPVDKAAFDVLDKHCARCHQVGRLDDDKPRGGIGNILMLGDIERNPDLILRGKPDNSDLFTAIQNGAMPADNKTVPSAPEIESLRAWIVGLENKQSADCAVKAVMPGRDIVAAIAKDLDGLRTDRVSGTRYLTLTNVYGGDECATNAEFDVYRKAVVKLLNGLSRNSTIVKLETVDPAGTIIRFNISDLGWDAADWDHILKFYHYGVKHDTHQLATLQSATGTHLPFIRADWFVHYASQPPLYDRLLKLPSDFHALLKEEGINYEDNLRRYLVKRAGFQNSGVSDHNRMIERHEHRSGYFWTSYDFAGSGDKQSLFRNPVGPGKGEFDFVHDGGETIFSLPNGFQAYYLNTADGKSLAVAPVQIVRDTTRKRGAEVINGISCMSCHDRGMKHKDDEVGPLTLKDRTFPNDVHDAVRATHPEKKEMDAIFKRDEDRFMSAMKQAGLLDPTKPGEPLAPTQHKGLEMTFAFFHRYETPVTLHGAAAEFGMSTKEFSAAMRESGTESLALLRMLEQGTAVHRDRFEKEFLRLVADITREDVYHPTETIRKAIEAPGAAGSKAPPSPGKGFDLTLVADKSRYRVGDLAVFTVTSTRDCHLSLVNVDSKGKGTIIFPNELDKNNAIKANVPTHFGAQGAAYEYALGDRGHENIIAVCNASSQTTRGLEADFKAGGYTDIGDYGKRSAEQAIENRKRQITIRNQIGVRPSKGGEPPAAPLGELVGRAQIRVEVQ